jgi:hypothetical protein
VHFLFKEEREDLDSRSSRSGPTFKNQNTFKNDTKSKKCIWKKGLFFIFDFVFFKKLKIKKQSCSIFSLKQETPLPSEK